MMSMLSKENINEIFEDIKKNLTRGVKDRKHTFHTPVFCNIDNENNIQSRVVVLRQFDSPNMVLNFHTSQKRGVEFVRVIDQTSTPRL